MTKTLCAQEIKPSIIDSLILNEKKSYKPYLW